MIGKYSGKKVMYDGQEYVAYGPCKDKLYDLAQAGSGKTVVAVAESSLRPVDPDMVSNPPHYTAHPSGVECIQVTEHMSFTLGNVIKYVWRADSKGNAIEDLEKAAYYLNREIELRKGAAGK